MRVFNDFALKLDNYFELSNYSYMQILTDAFELGDRFNLSGIDWSEIHLILEPIFYKEKAKFKFDQDLKALLE